MSLETSLVVRLLIAILGMGVGSLLFLIFVNRVLSYIRDRRWKPVALFGALAFFVAGLGGLGFGLGYPRGLALTLALLAGVVVGETYLNLQRRRTRSYAPVEVHRPQAALDGWWALLSHPLTTTDLAAARYEVRGFDPAPVASGNGRLPQAGRMRIVHLSDLHVNPRLPMDYYEQVIQCANEYQPDLVFITGDFVTHTEDIPRLPGLLRQLRSRHGCYAILGNHDYWAGAKVVRQALAETGVEWIGNGWRRVQADGLPPLLLAGCEAPWNRQGAAALPERRPDERLLVLSHTADYVFPYSRQGAAAMFTGHYHAGQFRLPYLGALIVPSKHGRRFDHGHFQVGPTHLFVSAGVGCAAPAFRLYCPPDFYIVDFLEGWG